MLKTPSIPDVQYTAQREADDLLAWYSEHGRDLPWRAVEGPHRDYKIWLSEIMLQQTVVKTVLPYYHRFLERWPRLDDLAVSSLEEVLGAWAGLGYYARARNLHRCAQIIKSDYGGTFPKSEKELLKLPGIGPYTAAALAAFWGGQRAVVVDGNVERVISRYFAVEETLPKSKPEIYRRAADLTPARRPGDYAQALMDLGAMICTPKTPKCDLCPWSLACQAQVAGNPEAYPRRLLKKPKPKRYGTVFWIEDEAGNVLLETRPQKGIFGGMNIFPGTNWDQKTAEVKPADRKVRAAAPISGNWKSQGSAVRHVFTHFDLELDIWSCVVEKTPLRAPYHWCAKQDVFSRGLPSAMKKVAALMI